jgi:uncharacterized protein YfaS (alpha-2-macroglobulin family)
MLGNKSGVIAGSVDTSPYIKKWEDYNRFLAEVTPFQVHVKMGHFNAIVWVTDLATGNPVENAEVSIYRSSLSRLTDRPEILTSGTTDLNGIAKLDGLEKLDPANRFIYGSGMTHGMFFTKVEKGRRWRFSHGLQLSHNSYSASNYTDIQNQEKNTAIYGMGTTAQGVYKAGDTIQYKIYVRNQDNERLGPAPEKSYSLKVIDPMDKTAYEMKDITLSEFGAFDGKFTVPETALLAGTA